MKPALKDILDSTQRYASRMSILVLLLPNAIILVTLVILSAYCTYGLLYP